MLLRDEYYETLLREVMIVGEDFSNPRLVAGGHGDTIYQTVCFIGSAVIEFQSVRKRSVTLLYYGNVTSQENGFK